MLHNAQNYGGFGLVIDYRTMDKEHKPSKKHMHNICFVVMSWYNKYEINYNRN
jgi:hypothetical protein